MNKRHDDGLDLKALKCFWSMAKHGSLVEAGVELGISEAMASKHVRSLENQLDTKLYETRNGKVELTWAGEQTVEWTTELFEEARLAIAFYRHHIT